MTSIIISTNSSTLVGTQNQNSEVVKFWWPLGLDYFPRRLTPMEPDSMDAVEFASDDASFFENRWERVILCELWHQFLYQQP